MDKIKVAILGATGIVGQRFIERLAEHPWFKIEYLASSPESKGKKFRDAVKWVLNPELPEDIADIALGGSKADDVPDNVDIVFSALPSSVALDVELELAKRGFTVISNSSPLRLEADIPLINPEVNYDHMNLIELQHKKRGWRGVIIKNPNCTTAILTLSLAPILNLTNIEYLTITTMQSISGAGLKGLPAYLIYDNIIPYIENEEYKVKNETLKILSKLHNHRLIKPRFKIYVTATRVPVLDSHLEVVYLKLLKEVSLDEIIHELGRFSSLPQRLNLPTAPSKPIILRTEIDRPQPRLDRCAGNGMSIVLGRVESLDEEENILRYVVLGNNTVRGAAGNSILIAELYLKYYLGVI